MTETDPLTLAAYQAAAVTSDKGPQSPHGSLAFPLLGLFGETGSLLSVAKKKQRDRTSYIGYGPALIEELGDVLWYLTIVAHRAGLALCDIANNVNRSFSDWSTGDADRLQFAELQAFPTVVQLVPTEAFEKTLLDLAAEVGVVLADFQAGRLDHN